jgi:hypothetical protein
LVLLVVGCAVLLCLANLVEVPGPSIPPQDRRENSRHAGQQEEGIYVSPEGYIYDMRGRLKKSTLLEPYNPQVRYEYDYNFPTLEEVLEALRQAEKSPEPPKPDHIE